MSVFQGPVGFYTGGGDITVNPDISVGEIDATVTADDVVATVSTLNVVCTVAPD